ncbi:MAG: hypothetical protein RL398_349 [Planctomycetota bacterium]
MSASPANPYPSAQLLAMRFGVAFVLLALLPAVVWDTVRGLGVDLVAADDATRVEWSMLGFVIACAAVVVFARWQSPGDGWGRPRVGWALVRYLPFLLGWSALLVGYLALARSMQWAVPPQPALAYLAQADVARPGFWLVALGTVVGAPLAEELVFRGFLQSALLRVLPPFAAVGTAAVIFGLCHTLPYALPVTLLGALFGELARRGGGLWPAIVAHSAHNLTTLLVTYFWPESLQLLYPQ